METEERREPEPQARDYLEYAAYRAGSAALRGVSFQAGQAIARRAAHAYFNLNPRGKLVRYALANLRVAYPERTEAERREIGRESFVQFAWGALDLIHAQRWSQEEVLRRVAVPNLDLLLDVLGRGRGALILTGHIGNFELAARAFGAVLSEKYRPLIMGRPQRNPLLYRDLALGRTSSGAELIGKRGVVPTLLGALRAGRPVVLLNDQYSKRSRGVFVPFFGVRCSTSAGLALVARRSRSPVLPAYAERTSSDAHRVTFLPEIEVPAAPDRERFVLEATASYNRALEAMIRAVPTQWLWSHRRFRHSPDLAGGLYDR